MVKLNKRILRKSKSNIDFFKKSPKMANRKMHCYIYRLLARYYPKKITWDEKQVCHTRSKMKFRYVSRKHAYVYAVKSNSMIENLIDYEKKYTVIDKYNKIKIDNTGMVVLNE